MVVDTIVADDIVVADTAEVVVLPIDLRIVDSVFSLLYKKEKYFDFWITFEIV
jgi:hypothetical protein